MARSTIASIMAYDRLVMYLIGGQISHTCVIIDASEHRLKIVSGVLNRVMMGLSMSSAELSKKEITVLSAVRNT